MRRDEGFGFIGMILFWGIIIMPEQVNQH